VGVAAICAERKIAGLHGGGEAGGDGLLTERQVAGALDEILQKQIVRALLGLANLDLQPIRLSSPMSSLRLVFAASARSSILAMNDPQELPGRRLLPVGSLVAR
jgi:hypothetical protein